MATQRAEIDQNELLAENMELAAADLWTGAKDFREDKITRARALRILRNAQKRLQGSDTTSRPRASA